MKNRSAYRRLMDAVVVTPELEERVLAAVTQRADRRRFIPSVRRLRLAALVAAICCAVLVIKLAYGGVFPISTPPVGAGRLWLGGI